MDIIDTFVEKIPDTARNNNCKKNRQTVLRVPVASIRMTPNDTVIRAIPANVAPAPQVHTFPVVRLCY